MASATCLLHITDLHLLAEPGSRLHGWDVSATFDRVLAEALATHPEADAVVLGGDLVDDESTTGYRWLDRRLHTLARPVLAVAGNHDDPAAMAEQLTCAAVHDVIGVGGWRLIGLDSHVPGSDAGRIGPRALAGLDRTLQADPAPALICVHHPPLDVGSAWIDAIGLVDRDALRATLARHPRVRGVVCGHVHQAGEYRLDGYPVWTTPSTMRQFRPGSPTFAEDSARPPGYRCLRLGADGEITTTVHRVPATRT
ncbi:metallophosphoesterase [Salinisphaera sp. RV14]|uniref:metallophosphoesterase n=1 Tax=unclassified Salinisphaera TaxID=2649847 RepID=UPI003F836034